MDSAAGKQFGHIVNYIRSVKVHATELQTAAHLTLVVTGWGARLYDIAVEGLPAIYSHERCCPEYNVAMCKERTVCM